MYLTITQIALIFYSQQGILYTLMRSLLNLFFQRINTSSQHNQTLWAAVCEPGFPFCSSPDWPGGIWVGCHRPLTKCHNTLADLHEIFLIFCHLGYSCNTQLLLRAMPGLVPNTAVFLALLSTAPDIQPYFCCVAEEASRIYSWLYFCLETPIFHFPYPYHCQITQRSTALLILTFFSPQSFSQVSFFSFPIICKLHHFYLSLCWKSYHERETFLFSFFN